MEKRQKNILVWLITWSALLLVILYSPIGSPDLYSTKKYFTPNQGVQFAGVEIQNAPSLKNRMNYQVPSVPDFNSPELSDIASYSVSVSEKSINSGSEAIPTQAYSLKNSSQKNDNSEGFNIGSGGSINSNKETKQQVNPPLTGFMALTTDLNGLSTNSPFQGVNGYVANTGATDPGFNDPVGDPIPIGDGSGLFIVFGLSYAILKKRFFYKKVNTN